MLNDADRIGLDQFLCSVGSRVPRDRKSILTAGAMLGNWRVEAFLGRGGSGEVYRVVHSVTLTPAAAKVLTKDDSAAAKRFAGEIAFLKEWHEAVGTAAPSRPQPFPRRYESGEIDGRQFVIMELLEPIDVPTDDKGIAEYLTDVCSCVRALHLSGVVHRDLKPKNIMRRSSGEVVLIDFGLAKDAVVSARPRTGVSIVSGKAVGVGTPEYAAPEQLTGGEISPAADIHALGRIANAAFGGKPPHSWEAIIRRATSSIPAQRYETVNDFATAIRKRNRFRNFSRAGLVAAIFALFAGVFFGSDELPLVRDVTSQMRFNAICETVATNVVTQQLLWEKLDTNKFGVVDWKERAFRNVTNAVDVTLVRLNRGTNVFVRPMQLKPNHEYWVVGPGILDASVTSSGTNTTIRLKNCVFLNRSPVPFKNTGIRYVFQGGAYLNFTNLDRPKDFTARQFEGFDGAFDEIRFKGESSERFKSLGVGEEVQKPHIEDSVVVVISGLERIVGDDELLEGVASVSEREGFLCPLFGVWDHVGGLDVDSARPAVDDKVDFVFGFCMMTFDAFFEFDDTDIDRISPPQEFVVDDVLHEVGYLDLSKVYPRVAKSGIGGVVFHGEVKIVPPTDIIALSMGKNEGIFEAGQIPGYGVVVGRNAGSGCERIGDSRRIERAGDIAHGEVNDTLKGGLRLDFVSLDDVTQIDCPEKIFEIGFLFGGRMHERTFRKTSIDEIVVQSGEGIDAMRGELVVFGKGERCDVDNLTAAAKLGGDIRSQQPRVGAGHIDIGIWHRTQAAQDRVKSQISPFFFVRMNAGRINVGVPFALTKLNFVDQNVIADSIVNQMGVDEILKCGWSSERLCVRIFKIDFDDVVFRNPVFEQMRFKQMEQKITLSAAANASDNLDKIVVFRRDQPIQQFSSFDVHSYCAVLNFVGKSINQESASCFVDITKEQEGLYHFCTLSAIANNFHFPRHILCSKHEYIMESMKMKDTEVASNDESFDFHLDPNRVRTNAEIQLFADVFSISFEEARRILIKTGRRCESFVSQI